ncbi:MAG: tRNA-intron lyase [Nanoarchaeota archaeon]|nr:tRNA-intron lyase [Nanoarchaeota archaeon]
MVMKKKTTKKSKTESKIINAVFSGKNATSNSTEAKNLYAKSRFGEPVDEKIQYSLVEALYLIEKKKMEIKEKSKKISARKFKEKIEDIDKKINTNYIVFKDMRQRGYLVKTALKFGAEFRVYEKGVKPGQDHAKWILYPVHESDPLTWHEFSGKNRVAHSTKKNLLIAIVDDEGDVTYYEVKWTKP